MSRKTFSELGIRQRVLLLTLLPLSLISLSLATYVISSKINQERTLLFGRSQLLLNYMADGAEFGLFSENTEALEALARHPSKEREVTDILFLNTQGEVVYQTGTYDLGAIRLIRPTTPPQEPIRFKSFWMLQAPVVVTDIVIDDYAELNNQQLEHLGWVVLLVNDQEMKQRQRDILYGGLLITIFGLALAAGLAIAIGRSITRPIQAIIETIYRLSHEDLAARVKVDSGGELGELERGINSLADRVQLNRIQLEKEVDEATENLRITLNQLEEQNTTLDTARSRAEEANRAKDDFLARMSHELRTPLTSVIGFAKLLRKTEQSPEQEEYSNIITRTSTLLLRLIDDILDFSKLQSNAIQLETIPFNLVEVLEDIIEMHAPIANEKGIDLYLVGDPALPNPVYGDPTRVQQVLTNLVSNAVKFTDSGEVRIALQCTQSADQLQADIDVIDTGIGITDEQMQTLFQPFVQADSSITRRFGGSGLGLLICRHFTRLLGGKLTLTSKAGEGSCAQVQLFFELDPNRLALTFDENLYCFVPNSANQNLLPTTLGKWPAPLHFSHDLTSFIRQLEATETLKISLPNAPPAIAILQLTQDYSCGYLRSLLDAVRRHFNGTLVLISPAHIGHIDPELVSPYAPIHCLREPFSLFKLKNTLVQPPDTPRSSTSSAADNGYQPLQGLDLLVAEDNAFNRVLISRMLEHFGATPTIVSNGEEVLTAVQAAPYDCILMDVHMPVMDGIEASRQIKALGGHYAEIPILALTANVIANEVDALKATGVSSIIFKPISESQLVKTIVSAVNMQHPDTTGQLSEESPQLASYGITDAELSQELEGQIRALLDAFKMKNIPLLRDHSHQLIGLAALLSLEDLEMAAVSFNTTTKSEDYQQMWQALWPLQRIVKQSQKRR